MKNEKKRLVVDHCKSYCVGDSVFIIHGRYRGFYGSITDIVKKSESGDDWMLRCDILYSLDVLDHIDIEERFSAVEGRDVYLKEIPFRDVLLPVSHVIPLVPAYPNAKLTNYLVIEKVEDKGEIENGEIEIGIKIFDSYHGAHNFITQIVNEGKTDGVIKQIRRKNDCATYSDSDSYECYLYDENISYEIYMREISTFISDDTLNTLGRSYIKNELRKKFLEKVAERDALSHISDEKIYKLVGSDSTIKKIEKCLKSSKPLADAFEDAFSQAFNEIIDQFLHKHN